MMRLVASAVALLLAASLGRAALAQTPAGPVVGTPAPPFALTTIDGKPVRLADYRGRTLVINVWGSWCPPCRLETPDLIAEARAGAARGVAFLGVDTTETASVVRSFVVAKGVPYPQAVTTADGAFARAYAIRNYPTTLVIGPDGVLRARHADNVLPRAQLRAYIAAAQRGESAAVATAFQAQLDALLDPSAYPFDGDPASVSATVKRAAAAIAQADELQDDAMNDAARDHDLIKTQHEQDALRTAAIAALAPIASSGEDRALLARLRGDDASARGDWTAADAAYAAALALVPGDLGALSGRAYAASQRGDAAAAAAIDAQIAQRAPSYASEVTLGRALAKAGDLRGAERAFGRALVLAGTPVQAAWTNLYFGRTEAAAGRRAQARAAFARAAAAAQRIRVGNPRREWYVEQAQEASVALDLEQGGTPGLSLAPWTGPDLPGSLASTLKYRLVVTAAPGTRVGLQASGLPPRWIASFCSDRVCAPFRTGLVLPAAGVKIVEFQVVPTTARKGTSTVRIALTSAGRTLATVGTPVHV